MKFLKTLLFISVLSVPALVLLLGAKAPPSQPAKIARGKYLVGIAGCSDCHTPLKMGPKGPEPDFTRYMAGHPQGTALPAPPKLDDSPWFAATAGMTAWAGPWGISYASNLTPDQNSGLGIWTEEIFINTMRSGKHYGVARDILPPMPWRSLAGMTDEDLKAVFAFLRSIPPVKNLVPPPVSPSGMASFE